MFVRSILSSYYRLLAGLSLALLAIVLTGCNEVVAEKAAPSRPVGSSVQSHREALMHTGLTSTP